MLGNEEKFDRAAWAAGGRIAVADIMAVTAMRASSIDAIEGRTRAFVQVQNGCDHRCTFCIIPFGRGNSRSLPMHDVVAQVRRLVGNGYREVVLTGVDITGYARRRRAPGRAGQAHPARGAGAGAAAAVVDRFGRSRCRSARRAGERAAADAASASVVAGRRRPHSQAHEAAAFARRGDRVLRTACGGCVPTSRSAPTSSPASRPRPKTCSRARSIWSMSAG